MITIHDFPGGARGLRAAWLCEEMGLTHAFVPISFPPSEAYRRLNPLGTVPYLEDGSVSMSESVAILLYLTGRYGPTDLLPPADDDRYAQVLQFTVFGEAALSAAMNPLLAVRYGAPDADKPNWSAKGIERRLNDAISHLADSVGERAYLVGDSLSLADISVATALQIWERGLGKVLPDRLAAYRDRLLDRPAYIRAADSHTPRATD
jgi:glutathione S-transferase